jgi:polyphenol oxidase
MPFYQSGEIKYFRFSTLENQEVYHAVFTRHGGISPEPWCSLNFGASVGDELQRVAKNRETALGTLLLHTNSVFDVHQVHSTIIVKTDRPLALHETHLKADAILTNKPEVTLMMRFADCVPILLYDPVNRAIGIVHAGWVGTVDKIARKTVMAMVENYNTNPKYILAAIGPSIGPDHYMVGKDVLDRVHSSFGDLAKQVIINKQSKSYLDLWKANQIILLDVGVSKIENCEICTYCNLQDWYSHRGENGKTGRFGVIFGLNHKIADLGKNS